jgi:hypothetical protein
MSRTTRAFRRNAAAHQGSSVEFVQLLDAIGGANVLVADPVEPVAVEPADEPAPVSRFADAGLDDDRLPIRSTARRPRRR